MRLDLFLSTVGVIKRRAEAKGAADAGMVTVNNRAGKAGQDVKVGDIVTIAGNNRRTIEILRIPVASVPKSLRSEFFRELPVV